MEILTHSYNFQKEPCHETLKKTGETTELCPQHGLKLGKSPFRGDFLSLLYILNHHPRNLELGKC